VPGDTSSHLVRGRQVLLWKEVMHELGLRYGLEPLISDPRRAELPSGILSEVPEPVAEMLEQANV
jgi:hypothetical protein